ncbi:hypothetical protein DsansV1_C09g0094951 [Dioscorea sansibarensis]
MVVSRADTKVLCMANTVAVGNKANHAIEELHSELQKGQAKLKAAEELKGQSGSAQVLEK